MDFNFPDVQTADALVAFEDVDLTLEALLSHSFVEEVEHDGILFPQWFDRITEIPRLKILEVRKTAAQTPCTHHSATIPIYGPHLQLKWAKLRQMHSLRVLRVSQLLAAEAVELAHAVWSLSNLEELSVGFCQEIQEAKALTVFLKSFFLANETAAPVSSLKSLSLVDCQHP